MARSTESSAPWAVRHSVAFRRLIVVGSLLTAAIILVPLLLIATGRVDGSAAVALAVFSAVSVGLVLIPVKPRLRRPLRSTGETKTDLRLGPGAFDGGKFGPNASQVARFLNGVASLSPAQWDEVQQAELLHDASLVRAWRTNKDRDRALRAVHDAETTAPRHEGIASTQAAMDQVVQKATDPRASSHWIPILTLRTACTALVYRDSIPPWAFATLYAPFERVIPAAALD